MEAAAEGAHLPPHGLDQQVLHVRVHVLPPVLQRHRRLTAPGAQVHGARSLPKLLSLLHL